MDTSARSFKPLADYKEDRSASAARETGGCDEDGTVGLMGEDEIRIGLLTGKL